MLYLPGLYMTATSWGPRPWILVGLASLVLIAVLGAIQAELRVRGAILIGVLFVMTVKPALLVSLATVAVAIVLGYAAGRIPRRGFTDARV